MAQIRIPKFPDTRELTYNDFSGGLNYKDSPSIIKVNQTPECQNVRVRDGTIGKRPGYKRIFATSLGTGAINGLYEYKKADGTKYRLIAWGTNLYTQSGTSQPVSIKSGLANAKATFFVLSDACYMVNGTDFISYDGTTCADVVGHIPTVLIGRSPSGTPNAGTASESFNLSSAGFKISFTADGTSITYTLPYTNLDATLLSVEYNGVTYAELVSFTVDRTAGTITTPLTVLGDSTSQFDITNTAGTTYRYTWDTTGTDPGIGANLAVNDYVYVNAQNFSAANNGWFKVTAKDTNYFEITNAVGVAENNKTIGTGSLNRADVTGVPLGIPAVGNPDNVVITAYKASLTHPEYIKNCTLAEVYGGKTEATVFMSGNPNFPDQVWRSRLYGSNYNADYFPDDGWQKVPGNVVGLAHIFDLLYISHSKGHGYMSYLEGTTYPSFPYSDINLEKGTDIPGSIQEADNTVVCASTTNGVMQVLSNTTVNNRLSVNDVSTLINMAGVERSDLGLLRETDLQDAVSYNFDGYYGLCVNDVCYVWDYRSGAWLYDTNITASCFTVIDSTLCFGSNTDGLIYQFDPLIANDDGVAIDGWYKTRVEDAGTPTWVKVIKHINLVAKPMNRGSVNVLFLSRQGVATIALDMQTTAFSLGDFTFVGFTFVTSFFPVAKRKRTSKRANFFQFKFGNDTLDEGMSVISLRVEFEQGTEMR